MSFAQGNHKGLPWGVKFEPISEFIFHPIFIPNGGMVGKRAVKSGFILSSLRPVYPPYKSCVKKIIPYLKFNTPGLPLQLMSFAQKKNAINVG